MAKALYILEIISPVFIILGIGYALLRIGFISERFKSELSKFVFYIALPVLLFINISKADLFISFIGKLIGLSILTVSVIFFLCLLVVLHLNVQNDKQGPFVQGSYRCNLAYIGIPITLSVFGADILPAVGLFIAFVAPVFNVFAVLSLTLPRHALKEVGGINKIGREIITNPIILSCIAGIIASLIGHSFGGVRYPTFLEKSLVFITQTTVPLALICVGASLKIGKIDNLAIIVTASLIKLVIMPLLGFTILTVFNVTNQSRALGTILLATPTAIASHIMTRVIGGNDTVSADIVMVTHVLSIITLTLWLFIVT